MRVRLRSDWEQVLARWYQEDRPGNTRLRIRPAFNPRVVTARRRSRVGHLQPARLLVAEVERHGPRRRPIGPAPGRGATDQRFLILQATPQGGTASVGLRFQGRWPRSAAIHAAWLATTACGETLAENPRRSSEISRPNSTDANRRVAQTRTDGPRAPSIPRANLLAQIAAEYPIADRQTQRLRDRCSQLDRQITDATRCVQHVRLRKGVRGADLQARLTATTMVRRKRIIEFQYDIRDHGGQEEPTAQSRWINIVFLPCQPRPANWPNSRSSSGAVSTTPRARLPGARDWIQSTSSCSWRESNHGSRLRPRHTEKLSPSLPVAPAVESYE